MMGMLNSPTDEMMKTGILMIPPSDLVSSVFSLPFFIRFAFYHVDYTQSPFLSLSICVFLCAILFDQVKLQVSIAMLSEVSVCAIKSFSSTVLFPFAFYLFLCGSLKHGMFSVRNNKEKIPVNFIEFPYDVVQQPQHACAM